MAELGFRIIGADNRYYEPDDCFTRHMEQAHANKAVNIRREGNDYGMVYIGDDRHTLTAEISAFH